MASVTSSHPGPAHPPAQPSSLSSEKSLLVHRQYHNSSKLPSFRFADLKTDFALRQLSAGRPAAAVEQAATQTKTVSIQMQLSAGLAADPGGQMRPYSEQQQPSDVANPEPLSDPLLSTTSSDSQTSASRQNNTRTRAATFEAQSLPSSSNPLPSPKRPATSPLSSDVNADTFTATTLIDSETQQPPQRRSAAPAKSSDLDSSRFVPAGSATSSGSENLAGNWEVEDDSTKEWAQGQRELLLPKALQSDAASTDERRKSRPPVSYRPPLTPGSTPGGRAVIPPIRSFRSSGSRKSLGLDMSTRPFRVGDDGDEGTDVQQRDRTLRALEGTGDDDTLRLTPPDSADRSPDEENTANLFLRLAREDRSSEVGAIADEPRTASRLVRSGHRRPLSVAVPSSQITSPPQLARRLSDQREDTRSVRSAITGQPGPRALGYSATTRDRLQLHTGAAEDLARSRTAATLRPSPVAPRSFGLQESADGSSAYARRRTSITESASGISSRKPPFKVSTLSHNPPPRSYYSSPLAPRALDAQRGDMAHGMEQHAGMEGTESSASTAAASTVWDELDDLKSRIHRLELTGKLPQTSGAAISRAVEDRPPTATTTGTTISMSPKRPVMNGISPVESGSVTPSQRETSSILMSALEKSKASLSPEVYGAIESAATDALALCSMMGSVGQPGPISSAASTIGPGASVTDRQLRRKADSVCRSLTELCLALNEERGKQTQQAANAREKALLTSPTAPSSAQRPGTLSTTARAMTRAEERRASLMSSSTAMPATPRFAAPPAAQASEAGPGRRSSLLIARSRRAGTEEPPEESGRKSSLLRSRRAGTEEPESGRRSSLLQRRQMDANNGEADDEPHVRAPSRAATEVGVLRTRPREGIPQLSMDGPGSASSGLPRRRMIPSTTTSRLATPSATHSLSPSGYTPRTPTTRDPSHMADRLAEDREQRRMSLSQTAVLNRTGSLNRRNRDSMISSVTITPTNATTTTPR